MMTGNIINHYTGVIVPMVTPLTREGNIDQASAIGLIQHLQKGGTIPFILGTTGEGSSVPLSHREALVNILIKNKINDQPAIAGVPGLPFRETVETANRYLEMGIDAVVLTLPNYYKLTERQMFHYFESLADRITGDIILYNIPKTIHMSIPVQVIDKLSFKQNIIGIKDSEADEIRLADGLSRWRCRTDFFHLVGVNSLIIKGLMMGSNGMVPGSGNILPELYANIYDYFLKGEVKEAERLFFYSEKLGNLYQSGKTLGESIASLKSIMSSEKLCLPFMYPPLSAISAEESNRLIANFQKEINHEI